VTCLEKQRAYARLENKHCTRRVEGWRQALRLFRAEHRAHQTATCLSATPTSYVTASPAALPLPPPLPLSLGCWRRVMARRGSTTTGKRIRKPHLRRLAVCPAGVQSGENLKGGWANMPAGGFANDGGSCLPPAHREPAACERAGALARRRARRRLLFRRGASPSPSRRACAIKTAGDGGQDLLAALSGGVRAGALLRGAAAAFSAVSRHICDRQQPRHHHAAHVWLEPRRAGGPRASLHSSAAPSVKTPSAFLNAFSASLLLHQWRAGIYFCLPFRWQDRV